MSVDAGLWLAEAKKEAIASECGMFLIHNGVVRASAKAKVREGIESLEVLGMEFSYDSEKAEAVRLEALAMPGIKIVKIWLNEGRLCVGDDIMYVLIGGDTRPHVVDALNFTVGSLKEKCVNETEIFAKR